MNDTPAPPPEALLIVSVPGGFAIYDPATSTDTDPGDLLVTDALSLWHTPAEVSNAVHQWAKARLSAEPAP